MPLPATAATTAAAEPPATATAETTATESATTEPSGALTARHPPVAGHPLLPSTAAIEYAVTTVSTIATSVEVTLATPLPLTTIHVTCR